MLKLLLAFAAVAFAPPALGETLIPGAVYFDSENTFLEVVKLADRNDNEAIGRLLTAHHVSERVLENMPITVYLAGPKPDSPAEFRFTNSPTTYWTLSKFIEGYPLAPLPTPSPTPLPASLDMASSSPASMPTPPPRPSPSPLPSATPALKSRAVAKREREEGLPLRKHSRRIREKEEPPSKDEEAPNSEKVWHRENGHWRWYLKRAEATPTPNIPTATAIPNPNYIPVLRALPVP